MNKLQGRTLTALLLGLLLSACGTTAPTHYYLLAASEGSAPSNASPALGIGPIAIPEYLNRNGLVYNRDGTQLQIANYERWAEPLASGVERVLGLNLASLLDTQNVQSFPWQRSQQPDYGVQVTVLQMDATADGATLIAEWVLQKPQAGKVLSRTISQLREDMPGGEVSPEQIAPVYSALLSQLSEIIAARITEDMTD